MQKILRLIARHESTHVRHCKENAPIYMYYVAPETPMMSGPRAPQYFGQVYAYGHENQSQSRPSVFMLEFSGQLTTPDRFSYHTGCTQTTYIIRRLTNALLCLTL